MKLTEITDTNPDMPIAFDIIRKALKDGKKVTFESPIQLSAQARHEIMTGDVIRLELVAGRYERRSDLYYHETKNGHIIDNNSSYTQVSNAELEDCDIIVTGNVMHIKLPNYVNK